MAGLAIVVHPGDGRMGQGPGMTRLSPEPGQGLGMPGILGAQQLDRHWPVQHGVYRPPDLAHAARGDPAIEPVPACDHWPEVGHHTQRPYPRCGR